jgi:hypothetical protein
LTARLASQSENAKASELRFRLCSRKGRRQMRILLVTACLIALVISAWSNYSSVADAKLRGDFTVKPTSLTSTGHQPLAQHDAF